MYLVNLENDVPKYLTKKLTLSKFHLGLT